MPRGPRSGIRNHSLSLVVGGVLVAWFLLYWRNDPETHWGAFFGNSIADWLGSLVAIVATKFWYEKGSVESRLPKHLRGIGPEWVREHSLTIVLLITWIGWIYWYSAIEAGGKTGQVVGNIVSEWGQLISLVWFTKYLYERGSKESH
jgi:hypothetical protein